MRKLSYEEVKEFIEGNGCKLLSTEYVNNKTKLRIQCACGEVFEKSFNNFSKKQRQCNKCSGITKWDFDMVKEFIEGEEGNGCKLLSTEYVDNKTKLRVQCACGEVFEVRFNEFKDSKQRQCRKCSGRLDWDFDMVKEFIEGEEGNGCKLLSTEYTCSRSKLKIQCACGEVFVKEFGNFKNSNQRQCNKCAIDKISGKNNYRYNPNITDEERFNCRKSPKYDKWRKDVYDRDNYTCQCCGSKKSGSFNAHHLNGHNWNEKYRTSKLNGVTLCKKCHDEFHSIYGYGNNTIIQFRDFIYKKYLQTNDPKYLTILKDIDIRITLLVDNLTLSLVN